jgi:hypothetical protein
MATYRNYLQSLADSGNGLAQLGLEFQGDDGGINQNMLNSYYDSPLGDRSAERDATAAQLNDLYKNYSFNSVNGATTDVPNNLYGTGSTYDPQQVALYDQAIGLAQNQEGRLDVQQNNALGQLLGQYNTGLSGLNTDKARTETDYNTNKTQSTRDNITANSNIDFSTGRQANALQRLLGSRGAGSSSAARIAAPYAAGLQGSQQRSQVKDAYSQNMGALDTSFNRYNEDWNTSKMGLDNQFADNQNQVKSGIAEKRSGLLQTLANLQAQRASALGGNPAASAQPYIDQITALSPQIDALGTPRSISVQNPTYAQPDLAKYDYDRTSAPKLQAGNALQEQISPYLSLLLKGKKNELASY